MKWSTLKIALMAIISLSQILILVFFLIYKNINIFLGSWSGNANLTIYLKTDTTEKEKNDLLKILSDLKNTENAKIIDRQQAAVDFEKSMGQYAQGLMSNDEIIDLLPETIELTPKSHLAIQEKINFLSSVAEQMKSVPIVQESISGIVWLKKFSKIDQFLKLIGLSSFIVLLLAMGFLSGLMIRVLVDNSKSEIEVFNLLGATRWSIYKIFIKDLAYTSGLSISIAIATTYMLFILFQKTVNQYNLGKILSQNLTFLNLSEFMFFLFSIFVFIFICSAQSLTSSLKKLTQSTYD